MPKQKKFFVLCVCVCNRFNLLLLRFHEYYQFIIVRFILYYFSYFRYVEQREKRIEGIYNIRVRRVGEFRMTPPLRILAG